MGAEAKRKARAGLGPGSDAREEGRKGRGCLCGGEPGVWTSPRPEALGSTDVISKTG